MKNLKRGLSNDTEAMGNNVIIEPCKCDKCDSEFAMGMLNKGCAWCNGQVVLKSK